MASTAPAGIRLIGRAGLPLGLALVLLVGACGRSDPSLVAEMDGWSLTLDQLAARHEALFPDLPFAEATPEERVGLLEDLVNNELLVGIARREVDALGWALRRRMGAAREQKLIDLHFAKGLGRFGLSEEDHEALRQKLSREAHLLRIMPTTPAAADSCYRDLQAGLGFSEAYERYSIKEATHSTALDLDWLTPDLIPLPVAAAVFLGEMEPGQHTAPITSRRGIWITKLLDIRPAQPRPVLERRVEGLIGIFAQRDTMAALRAELEARAGLTFYEENFPIVNRCLTAYWDSLDIASQRASRNLWYAWRAPVWHLAPEERDVPIYSFHDETGTADDFLFSLHDCEPESWPGGPTREQRAVEIRSRVHRLLLKDEAIRQGFDQDPEFLEFMRMREDEAYLDALHEQMIRPQLKASPEEVRAEWETHPEDYMIPDKAGFMALFFPAGKRPRAVAFREAYRDSAQRVWLNAARAAQREDPGLYIHRDQGVVDLDKPPADARLRPLYPVVLGLETGEVSEVVDLPDGWSAVIRCNYRRHTEPFPEEMGLVLAEGEVMRQQEADLVERMLAEERRRRDVRVYPERARNLATNRESQP